MISCEFSSHLTNNKDMEHLGTLDIHTSCFMKDLLRPLLILCVYCYYCHKIFIYSEYRAFFRHGS